MKGRKPVPSALKLLRGNPGKRALPENEPVAPAGEALPPEWLGKYGLAHWREIAPMLQSARVLTVMDAQALGDMCLAYQKWREAMDTEARHGAYTKAQSGFPILAPWVTEGEKQRGIWRRMMAEFGMTPSSRSRVTATAAPKQESRLAGLVKSVRK